MKQIKIILADDHQIVRDGIKALLEKEDNIKIIDEAADGKELLEKIKQHKPDIVLMDISMPEISGIEATKILSTQEPDIKVLILSMYLNEDFILDAIKAGAKGYLPKNTTKLELIDAINTINSGNNFFSQKVSSVIINSYVKKEQNEDGEKIITKKLTSREIEILKLFAEGYTNKEIADNLFISIRTVESHKNHIMKKFNVKNTVQLIKLALKNKIIDL